MRDPRLRHAWERARDDRRRAAADQLLTVVTATDRTEIDRLLADWWTGVLAEDASGDQWETAQVEHLRRRVSSLPADSQEVALMALGTLTRDAAEKSRGIGSLLLGESAAVAVQNSSSFLGLDCAVKFLSECCDAVEVLVDRLLDDPAWPEALETLTVEMADIEGLVDPDIDRLSSHEALLEEDKHAREAGILAYFWGPYAEICLNETTLVRLTLLGKRNLAKVAIQADILPLRGLRDDLWRHLRLHEDRDFILKLLELAPTIFEGDSWKGGTSVLAALRAAVQFSDQVHEQLEQDVCAYNAPSDAEEKLKAFVENEVPEWMKRVTQTVIARPDGRLLLLIFGASLVRDVLRPPLNGHHRWSSAGHALSAIHDVLDPKPSIDEFQRASRLAGVPSNRSTCDYATYLVTSARFSSCANKVWAWYRALLLKSDDDLCFQAKNFRRGLCYEALAERLSNLADPFGEWRSTWDALFVTDREHARFAPISKNGLYPSLHLLCVGAELLRQEPLRSGAQLLFEEILARAQHLLASEVRFYIGLQPELIVDFIDVAPCVLGSDWPQSLKPYRHLLSVAERRLCVAIRLLSGGAMFSDLEAFFESEGHCLMDTVAEVKRSNRTDINVNHLCDIITDLARGDART